MLFFSDQGISFHFEKSTGMNNNRQTNWKCKLLPFVIQQYSLWIQVEIGFLKQQLFAINRNFDVVVRHINQEDTILFFGFRNLEFKEHRFVFRFDMNKFGIVGLSVIGIG